MVLVFVLTPIRLFRFLKHQAIELLRLDHAQLQADKARVELTATLAAQQRIASRLGSGPVAPEPGKCESSVEKKLAELAGQMKEMNDRVTSIERLLLIHDNVIRDKVLSGPGAKVSATPVVEAPIVTPTTPKLPMIPPLP